MQSSEAAFDAFFTLANTEDVVVFSEQQREALHQQQSLVVAEDGCFPLVEHLVQRSSLNHLHSVAEQQPLGLDGGDLVH